MSNNIVWQTVGNTNEARNVQNVICQIKQKTVKYIVFATKGYRKSLSYLVEKFNFAKMTIEKVEFTKNVYNLSNMIDTKTWDIDKIFDTLSLYLIHMD